MLRTIQLLRRILGAIRDQRERNGLRVALYGLGDRELMDIGLVREEIDYVVGELDLSRNQTFTERVGAVHDSRGRTD